MSSELPNIDFRSRLNLLLAGLPAHLKDPANFDKVQKLILETLAGKCSHSEMVDWAACAKCQRRFAERKFALKKLGFKNPAQYREWVKVHSEIKRRFPDTDWSKKFVRIK